MANYIDQCLDECLVEFKKVVQDLDPKIEPWLLTRFRKNFEEVLGSNPQVMWRALGSWVKKQSKALGHYSVGIATARHQGSPKQNDIERAIELIRDEVEHSKMCPKEVDTTKGKICY